MGVMGCNGGYGGERGAPSMRRGGGGTILNNEEFVVIILFMKLRSISCRKGLKVSTTSYT